MRLLILAVAFTLLLSCGSDREEEGLGVGYGWTTDDIAHKLAIGYVTAHGHIDWRLDTVDKTKDGWIFNFISPVNNPVESDSSNNEKLLRLSNPHLYSNRHQVFVRCDGWSVEGGFSG